MTLFVEWSATGPGAEVLRLRLHGTSSSCADATGDESCHTHVVQGPSPLVVTLEGQAARDGVLSAALLSPDPCEDELYDPTLNLDYVHSCRAPGVFVVMDQPFQYRWIVES